MYDTSLGMIQNLLQDVKNHGFVPNGGRIYYLDRSQPPVLAEIVLSYTKTLVRVYNGTLTNELVAFLSSAYETLKKEYDFWMDERNGHLVTIGSMKLNRYSSQVPEPRPESYLEDYTNAGFVDISEMYMHLRAGIVFFLYK
jgi:alpha,alpha-trehalase